MANEYAMKPIPLGISVNTWNAVKFILLELFVSVVFVSTWNLFMRRASARALRSSAGVRLVPIGLGRFTPTEIGFYATKRLTARTAYDVAHMRVQHRRTRAAIVAVNLLLFTLLFMLEYGSTDLPNFERRRVAVVTAASITAHSRHTAVRARVIAEPSESVKQGFRPESRKALCTVTDAAGAPSQFKLIEHTIDDDGSELESPGVAVEFNDVCGDNDVTQIAHCATELAPFLSKNSTEGRRIVARVTHEHAFRENFHRIYDIAVEQSNMLDGDDKIDMRPRRLVGTCTGHRFTNEGLGSKDRNFTLQSNTCVLRESGSRRVFAVFPVRLSSLKLSFFSPYVTLLSNPDSTGPWLVPNASLFFETAAHGMLSFVPSVDVDTYTAVLSMHQHQNAYGSLYELNSLDFAPFREYRRYVLLLCLGLFGDYFERRNVRITKGTRQAAVNALFVIALAGLVLLVFVLAMASACMGNTRTLRLPVELRTQLLSIRSAARRAGDDGSRWPEFEPWS